MTMRFRLALGLAAATWAAACGVFSLNDVQPPAHDGGATDAAADVTKDAPADASSDSATPDGAAMCDAGADPCACLVPTLVSAGNGVVVLLRVDATQVYWVAFGNGYALDSAPVDGDGGPPTQIAAPSGVDVPAGMSVVDGYVYMVLGFMKPALTRFPVDAAAAETLAHAVDQPVDLTATSTRLFWTDDQAEICTAALDGAVGMMTPSGCGAPPYSPGVPGADGGVNHLLVGASSFWLSVPDDQDLWRVPGAGGPGMRVTTLESSGSKPLAGSDTDVFWVNDVKALDASLVLHETAAGGDASVFTSDNAIDLLAVDDTNVYYIAGRGTNRRIVEVSRANGQHRLLACDANQAGTLAVDSQYVYWGNAIGEVKRIAK
jgi:hypothetical protein